MAGILVYALHDDEGNFNKNSLGAISEAAKLAGEGGEAAALVVGDRSSAAASPPTSPASLAASEIAPSEFLLKLPSSSWRA